MKNKIVGLMLFYSVGAHASLGNYRPWGVQSCATNSRVIRPMITSQEAYERSEYDQQADEYKQIQNSLLEAAHEEKQARDKSDMLYKHEQQREFLRGMQKEHMDNLLDSYTFEPYKAWDALREDAESRGIDFSKKRYQNEAYLLDQYQNYQMNNLVHFQALKSDAWKNTRYYSMEPLVAAYEKEKIQYSVRKKNSTDIAVRPYQLREFRSSIGFSSSSVW
ncbi:MAG: hypothetical protein NTU89_02470 [Candidatus Dependentiae bacterium]|nr:hypothetical protein [Candidatus Dependentiae bacterium]